VYIYNFSYVLVVHCTVGVHLSSRSIHKLLLGFCCFFYVLGSFSMSIYNIFCTSLCVLSKYIEILPSKLPLIVYYY
jgi:hypothetical protein